MQNSMDTCFMTNIFAYPRKLLFYGTIFTATTATIYLIRKYLNKRKKKSPTLKPGKKKLKQFPTIGEIQKFIEDLPYDSTTTGKPLTLKDLLGELSDFSEDEDWKELIASVHTMYQDITPRAKDNDETGIAFRLLGSIMSIYEDPNAIMMAGMTPRSQNQNGIGNEKIFELKSDNDGKGDAESTNALSPSDKKEDESLGALLGTGG